MRGIYCAARDPALRQITQGFRRGTGDPDSAAQTKQFRLARNSRARQLLAETGATPEWGGRHVACDNSRSCCLARAGIVFVRRTRPSWRRRRAHRRWTLGWRPLGWWRPLGRSQSLRVSRREVPPPRTFLRRLCGLRLRMLALAADAVGLAPRMGMRVSLLRIFLKERPPAVS
jgi:hypothetical protein